MIKKLMLFVVLSIGYGCSTYSMDSGISWTMVGNATLYIGGGTTFLTTLGGVAGLLFKQSNEARYWKLLCLSACCAVSTLGFTTYCMHKDKDL